MVHGDLDETATEFELSVDQTKALLKKSREILYEARQKRPRPHLDDKMLTAWNGIVLICFLISYLVWVLIYFIRVLTSS